MVYVSGLQPEVRVPPGVWENIFKNRLNLEPGLILALQEDSSRNWHAKTKLYHLINRSEAH
jgi:hypothetical protein